MGDVSLPRFRNSLRLNNDGQTRPSHLPRVAHLRIEESNDETRDCGNVLALFVCVASYGQAADQQLQFEVASIKQSRHASRGQAKGREVLRRAWIEGPGPLYLQQRHRLPHGAGCIWRESRISFGLRVSTDTIQFNVEAKVPPGATAEQVKVMLRNLLTERFKLAFHYEKNGKRRGMPWWWRRVG